MTTPRITASVSRRSALAGLGASGLGVALAATTRPASAQEATPFPMAGHPLVGSWIVDRNPDDPTEIPTYNVITADGGVIDPTVGGAGVWEPTGPDTANITLTGTIAEVGGYFLVRGSLVVDAGGATATASYSSTILAADGTTMDELTRRRARPSTRGSGSNRRTPSGNRWPDSRHGHHRRPPPRRRNERRERHTPRRAGEHPRPVALHWESYGSLTPSIP